ncbi:LytR family transcriptional regulator, partial [Streptomyces globisporus]
PGPPGAGTPPAPGAPGGAPGAGGVPAPGGPGGTRRPAASRMTGRGGPERW